MLTWLVLLHELCLFIGVTVPVESARAASAQRLQPVPDQQYIGACFTFIQTYWLGPLLGGVLAGVLYDVAFAANASREKMLSLLTDGDYEDANFDEQGRRDSREPNDGERLKDDSSVQQDYGTMK